MGGNKALGKEVPTTITMGRLSIMTDYSRMSKDRLMKKVFIKHPTQTTISVSMFAWVVSIDEKLIWLAVTKTSSTKSVWCDDSLCGVQRWVYMKPCTGFRCPLWSWSLCTLDVLVIVHLIWLRVGQHRNSSTSSGVHQGRGYSRPQCSSMFL